jgi:hypothetical protein
LVEAKHGPGNLRMNVCRRQSGLYVTAKQQGRVGYRRRGRGEPGHLPGISAELLGPRAPDRKLGQMSEEEKRD